MLVEVTNLVCKRRLEFRWGELPDCIGGDFNNRSQEESWHSDSDQNASGGNDSETRSGQDSLITQPKRPLDNIRWHGHILTLDKMHCFA